MKDFVSIMGDIAAFIQQERNDAYEEAELQSIRFIKDWIREQKIDPVPDTDIRDLLNDFLAQWTRQRGGKIT